MRKLYILIIAVMALLVTGCENDPIHFTGPTFLEFTTPTQQLVVKDAQSGSLDIEIGISNKATEDMTINIVVDETKTTAVEGRDYDFVTKTVSIPAGKSVGTFKIKTYYDNLTPEGVKLVVKMDVDKSLIAENIGNEMTINITRFFEVTMDWICGNWIWTDADFETGETKDSDIYPVTITQAGENKIEIYNVWAGDRTIIASVDLDKGQISIAPDQIIYIDPQYGNTYMDWFNGTSYSRERPIIGECTFRGIQIGGWGAFVNDYQSGAAFGMYTSFLTKVE